MSGRWHNLPDLQEYFKPDKRRSEKVASKGDRGVDHDLFTFQLSDHEQELFDSLAQEHARIAGTPLRYWSLNQLSSTVDPLYNEPAVLAYDGPFEMVGVVGFPDGMPEAREQGRKIEFRTTLWIARLEFEMADAAIPQEGDVVAFWDIPFYDVWGSALHSRSTGGYYFDVVNVTDDGHLFDGPGFVGYSMEIKRNSTFTPERRLFGDQSENCG